MTTARYGDDPQLTRAARAAALRVAVAVAVTGILVVLSVALIGAKFGIFAVMHGGSGLLREGLTVVHWWGALLIFLGVVTIVTLRLVRAAPDPSMPRTAYELADDHPARQSLARLASLAGMSTPALLVVPSAQANAFVVDDDDHPVTVLITEGALTDLPGDELEAVLAHELFHVAHGDTRLTRRLEHLAGIAEKRSPWFGSGFVLRSVRAMARQRELSADRHAALLTGHPSVLLAAVQRCSGSEGGVTRDLREVATVGFVSTTSTYLRDTETHPSTDERAEVLARVASSLGS
jgi:Zn-dependent protease with chaperone function